MVGSNNDNSKQNYDPDHDNDGGTSKGGGDDEEHQLENDIVHHADTTTGPNVNDNVNDDDYEYMDDTLIPRGPTLQIEIQNDDEDDDVHGDVNHHHDNNQEEGDLNDNEVAELRQTPATNNDDDQATVEVSAEPPASPTTKSEVAETRPSPALQSDAATVQCEVGKDSSTQHPSASNDISLQDTTTATATATATVTAGADAGADADADADAAPPFENPNGGGISADTKSSNTTVLSPDDYNNHKNVATGDQQELNTTQDSSSSTTSSPSMSSASASASSSLSPDKTNGNPAATASASGGGNGTAAEDSQSASTSIPTATMIESTKPGRRRVRVDEEDDLLVAIGQSLNELETDETYGKQLEYIRSNPPSTELERILTDVLQRKDRHIEKLTTELTKLKQFISKRKQTYKRKRKQDGAPTRALSAYNIFVQDRFAALSKQNEVALKSTQVDATLQRIPPEQLVKSTGNAWKQLSTEEKQKYEERAKQDRKRYETEMAIYNAKLSNGGVENGSGGSDDNDGDASNTNNKKIKVEGGGGVNLNSSSGTNGSSHNRVPIPKRNKTGYNMFFTAHVLRMKQQEAQQPSGGPTPSRGSVAKSVGTAWKNLTHEERQFYEREADKFNNSGLNTVSTTTTVTVGDTTTARGDSGRMMNGTSSSASSNDKGSRSNNRSTTDENEIPNIHPLPGHNSGMYPPPFPPPGQGYMFPSTHMPLPPMAPVPPQQDGDDGRIDVDEQSPYKDEHSTATSHSHHPHNSYNHQHHHQQQQQPQHHHPYGYPPPHHPRYYYPPPPSHHSNNQHRQQQQHPHHPYYHNYGPPPHEEDQHLHHNQPQQNHRRDHNSVSHRHSQLTTPDSQSHSRPRREQHHHHHQKQHQHQHHPQHPESPPINKRFEQHSRRRRPPHERGDSTSPATAMMLTTIVGNAAAHNDGVGGNSSVGNSNINTDNDDHDHNHDDNDHDHDVNHHHHPTGMLVEDFSVVVP